MNRFDDPKLTWCEELERVAPNSPFLNENYDNTPRLKDSRISINDQEEFANLVAKKVFEMMKNTNPPPGKIPAYNPGVCIVCGGYYGGLSCPFLKS